jgi:hypothetical protein
MTIWLQNSDVYDELAELDPASGRYRVQRRQALRAGVAVKTDGTFALLGGVFAALYKFGDELILRVKGVAIPLGRDVSVSVSGPSNCRVLSVVASGREVIRHEYYLDLSTKFPNDPTPFVEDEDFDFGLFVANVAKAPERQDVLLGLA